MTNATVELAMGLEYALQRGRDGVRLGRGEVAGEVALDAGQPLDINLKQPVPVYFAYITAWAEPDGRVVFRPDLYGRDGVRDLVASHERDPGDS